MAHRNHRIVDRLRGVQFTSFPALIGFVIIRGKEFDRDFQRLRNNSSVVPLLIRNDAVKYDRVGAEAGRRTSPRKVLTTECRDSR